MAPTKTDFKKTLDSYKAKRGKFEIIEVPDLLYLKIPDWIDQAKFEAAVEQSQSAKTSEKLRTILRQAIASSK